MTAIEFHPIGFVKRDPEDQALSGPALRARSARIVLDHQLMDGMLGLEVGDDIVVLFYFHHSTDRPLQVHPRGDLTRPLQGVFATRSPARPNPIGVTTVRIEQIEENVIKIIGLDAIDGTPVLDIKSHADTFDTPYNERDIDD